MAVWGVAFESAGSAQGSAGKKLGTAKALRGLMDFRPHAGARRRERACPQVRPGVRAYPGPQTPQTPARRRHGADAQCALPADLGADPAGSRDRAGEPL